MKNNNYRFLWIALLAAVLLAAGIFFGASRVIPSNAQQLQPLEYAPNRVIVKYRADTSITGSRMPQIGGAAVNPVLQAHGVYQSESLFGDTPSAGLSQIRVLHLRAGSSIDSLVNALNADPMVEWAEPDYLAYPAATTPDDPLFPAQWGLAQIDAPTAWDTITGSPVVTIALIDSGVDFSHPDLADQLWVNPGEIAGNGLDDDSNDYIDDVKGWDFVNGDNDPTDDNGHGTQVAGVLAAAANNGQGGAGVCWGCRIIPVKVMQASGVANYSDVAAGVLYAAKKGAKVINISLGGYSQSAMLQAAVGAAMEAYGAVVIAGAGNDSLDTPFYPAAYPGVLAVAGTDQADAKAALSNYGDWIDLAAPAVAITTTFQGGDYGAVDGTSYAAAFVSGTAALLRSQHLDGPPTRLLPRCATPRWTWTA